MNGWFRLCLLIALFVIQFGMTARNVTAQERTRTFPAQKCRYTLPGPDWAWSDQAEPNMLFLAESTKGLIVSLACMAHPQSLPVSEQFVKAFEQNLYLPGQYTKRAGRFVTFCGLPGYQADGLYADGRTTSGRITNANKSSYMLMVIGTEKPVETDPAFESIMQGFEFTVPPAPSLPATATVPDEQKGEEMLGRIAGKCFMLAVAVIIAFRMRKAFKNNDPAKG